MVNRATKRTHILLQSFQILSESARQVERDRGGWAALRPLVLLVAVFGQVGAAAVHRKEVAVLRPGHLRRRHLQVRLQAEDQHADIQVRHFRLNMTRAGIGTRPGWKAQS